MDFYVFDLDFNFHGIIDDYVNIPVTRNYEKKTSFTIEVAPTDKNLQLLKKNRLIAKQTDIEHAFIIETIEFNDGKDSSLSATVFSLHHLLQKRAIIDQQTFYGKVGQVLSQFVEANAVNPANPNRKIPSLVIDSNNAYIGPSVAESRTSGQLDDVLFEIAIKFGVSWDILFDYENKQFVFKVWQGKDRSEQQSINPRVVFAKEFDNVIGQNYIDSENGYKNVAIVAGEGEGVDRKRVIVNDELSGFERNELFVDARDLQSTYYDENNQEVTIPESEYLNILRERGKSKLAELEPIEILDSQIDIVSSFKYEEDFYLGDIVSVKNTRLGIVAHTRIVEVIETFSKEGRTLVADFGSSKPTLIDKLKREVKR